MVLKGKKLHEFHKKKKSLIFRQIFKIWPRFLKFFQFFKDFSKTK